jgi:hypothetical protein
LNASLLVVVFTLSGKRFQLSTTLTGNEYFLTSVQHSCVGINCAGISCAGLVV